MNKRPFNQQIAGKMTCKTRSASGQARVNLVCMCFCNPCRSSLLSPSSPPCFSSSSLLHCLPSSFLPSLWPRAQKELEDGRFLPPPHHTPKNIQISSESFSRFPSEFPPPLVQNSAGRPYKIQNKTVPEFLCLVRRFSELMG